jgi:lysozyme
MNLPDGSLSPHFRAFLDTIAWSELGDGLMTEATNNGYRVIVGSTPAKPILFDSYADHPRRVMDIHSLHIYSTAAGRYQELARYFDAYKISLHLPDFSPLSQDKIAVQMIHECGAVDLIESGHIESAIRACSSRWASFPGNNYKQGGRKMLDLLARYATRLAVYA